MKQEIFGDHIEIQGLNYPINTGKEGCYKIIIERTVEQLLAMSSYHSKILVNMFVLQCQGDERYNDKISRLMRKITKHIRRTKNGGKMAYLWVREMNPDRSTHYHLAIFVNGNTFKSIWRFYLIIRRHWKENWDNGAVHYISRTYRITRNDWDETCKAVYHLSYLAKTRTKGCYPYLVNEYCTSRLKAK